MINHVSVSTVFENVSIFGRKTPLSFRKERMFLVDSRSVHFDIKEGRIEEVGRASSSLIATCRLSGPRPGVPRTFSGEVASDNFSITVNTDSNGLPHLSVTEGDGKWSFPVDARKGVFLDQRGFKLSADTARFFSGWSVERVVRIECEDSRMDLAVVLGVVVCSLLFDHLLDPANHV